MQRKASFKGIPQEHQAAVRRYMATVQKHVSHDKGYFGRIAGDPQAAYASLKSAWAEQEQRKTKEDSERKREAAQAEEHKRGRALGNVRESLTMFANVREMLASIGTGESFAGLSEEDAALVSQAALQSAGVQIELALLDLGVVGLSDVMFIPDEMIDTLGKADK